MKCVRNGGFAVIFVVASASLAAAQPTPTRADVAVVDTVAHVATHSVQTPFVGTFELSGGLKGVLAIGRSGDELTLGGSATEIRFSQKAAVGGERKWTIILGHDATGIMNRVGGTSVSANVRAFGGLLGILLSW